MSTNDFWAHGKMDASNVMTADQRAENFVLLDNLSDFQIGNEPQLLRAENNKIVKNNEDKQAEILEKSEVPPTSNDEENNKTFCTSKASLKFFAHVLQVAKDEVDINNLIDKFIRKEKVNFKTERKVKVVTTKSNTNFFCTIFGNILCIVLIALVARLLIRVENYEPEKNNTTVELPEFDLLEAEQWFYVVEKIFDSQNIKSDDLKLGLILPKFNKQTMQKIVDWLQNLDDFDNDSKYNIVKSRLIRLSFDQKELTQLLLEHKKQ